jgi:hypothetical protein
LPSPKRRRSGGRRTRRRTTRRREHPGQCDWEGRIMSGSFASGCL